MGVLSPTPTPFPVHHRKGLASRLTSIPQGLVLVLGDILTLVLALLIAGIVFGVPLGRGSVQATIVWGSVWIIWRAYQGLYPGYGRSPQTELRIHVVGTLQLAAVQLASALAVQRLPPSVGGVLLEWVLILILGLLLRYGMRAVMIRLRQFGRPISIIGAGRTAALAIAHLRSHPSYGLNPVVAYDDNDALHGTTIEGVPVVGDIALALERPQTQQALISIPGARAEVMQRVVNDTYSMFRYTWVVPDLIGVPNQALMPHSIGSIASLEVSNNLRNVRARAIKRIFDFGLSVLGLIVIFPLLVLIAVLIRLDTPGPILYRAPRLGRNHSTFDCYKFRSMYQDADERLAHLLRSDPKLKFEYDTYHKLRRDPRVTRIGALLRKFSLDELPQVLNVIRGEMSLVGPRPYLPREQGSMGVNTTFVVQVRPGMTGYWQVSGRNSSTFEERLDMDRFYVTNWTPWLDLLILMRTVAVVLRGHGAY